MNDFGLFFSHDLHLLGCRMRKTLFHGLQDLFRAAAAGADQEDESKLFKVVLLGFGQPLQDLLVGGLRG